MEVIVMLKACGWCGRMHDINAECPRKPTQKGRKYGSKTDADKLRNTYRWRRKREQIKQDAHYMCEVCADKGIINGKHLEVHHIIKLNKAPNLLTDDDNLICLCVTHHKQADAGGIEPTYLRQLARKRRN
jgi:5-methylcytosine-specific restriction protein A